jgi:hypothetical protein
MNYYGTCRSNYFWVKDGRTFRRWLAAKEFQIPRQKITTVER